MEPDSPARVTQAPVGTWQVQGADGSVLAACKTNAEAWKAFDKLSARKNKLPSLHNFSPRFPPQRLAIMAAP
jgi:hypothetical protein